MKRYTESKEAEARTKELAKINRITAKEQQDFSKRYKMEAGLKAEYRKELEKYVRSDIVPAYDTFVSASSLVAPSTFKQLVDGGNKYSNRAEFMKLVHESAFRDRFYNFIHNYFQNKIRPNDENDMLD